MSAETGVVDVGDVQLAWTRSGPRSGTRPTLLLAHGLTDSAECWNRVAHHLARTHDVVRYDARGHGSSSRSHDYLAQAHTADLIGVARGLGLVEPVVIGHSMGGVHATLAAAQFPVRALVLEDPAWPTVPDDGSKDIDASRRKVTALAAMSAEERYVAGRTLHPTWDEADLEPWSRAQTRLDPDVVDWFGSWPTTNAWRDHVAALDVPGLLLIGSDPPGAVKPHTALEARRLWPRVRVEQIEGAGHDIRRDQFERFSTVLTSFLEQVLPHEHR